MPDRRFSFTKEQIERLDPQLNAFRNVYFDRAVDEAKAAPLPTEADLLTDVYVRY